jgi:pantoate--beta-alanine ligase
MGNLHDGHLDLVRKARQLCDVVVVSIFVNPLQFGPNEDLDAYPRTLAADKEKLFSEGVQVLYAPGVEDIYPQGMHTQTIVHVPELGETLCGSSRPGHFDGVTTVVSKLFNIVQPDVAVFGEKDFQQLSIVRKMVKDLCLPIRIVGVATARDADGLAKSSRNGYLSFEQRRIAPMLNQTLNCCREAIACGFDNFLQLESHARLKLLQAGFDPDYFAIRDARTLRAVTDDTEEIAILAAARLGTTRLIDNVKLSLNPVSDWGMLAGGH